MNHQTPGPNNAMVPAGPRKVRFENLNLFFFNIYYWSWNKFLMIYMFDKYCWSIRTWNGRVPTEHLRLHSQLAVFPPLCVQSSDTYSSSHDHLLANSFHWWEFMIDYIYFLLRFCDAFFFFFFFFLFKWTCMLLLAPLFVISYYYYL